MKCIVMSLGLLLTSTLFAANRPQDGRAILKCLGNEEKRFHLKKTQGPVYELNQRLIAEMIQIPGIEINQEDYREVCTGERFSESWKLLELSIVKGKELFVLPESLQGMQRNVTMGMIEDYVDITKDILLEFIAKIQTQSPTPTCLKDEIPELDAFFTEIKYLQEDVDMQAIFKGKDKKIFDKLKNYPLAFEKCRALLKKKTKPSSKEAPKKS